jgi:hypothetical protein
MANLTFNMLSDDEKERYCSLKNTASRYEENVSSNFKRMEHPLAHLFPLVPLIRGIKNIFDIEKEFKAAEELRIYKESLIRKYSCDGVDEGSFP